MQFLLSLVLWDILDSPCIPWQYAFCYNPSLPRNIHTYIVALLKQAVTCSKLSGGQLLFCCLCCWSPSRSPRFYHLNLCFKAFSDFFSFANAGSSHLGCQVCLNLDILTQLLQAWIIFDFFIMAACDKLLCWKWQSPLGEHTF